MLGTVATVEHTLAANVARSQGRSEVRVMREARQGTGLTGDEDATKTMDMGAREAVARDTGRGASEASQRRV